MELPLIGSDQRRLLERRFWSKVQKPNSTECWEWQASCAWNGYGRFNLTGSDNERAHRVALALALNKNLESSEWVLHRCDNRKCCNPSHLYIGSRSENIADAVLRNRTSQHAKGNTWTVGSSNGQSKLTEEQVALIKQAIKLGKTNRQIANAFGVSATTISLIRNNLRWAHVV